MMSRRQFFGVFGTGLVYTWVPRVSAAAPASKPVRRRTRPQRVLTTIAYNVLQCTGWPPELAAKRLGDVGTQIPERLALELAIYHPDIISFSEAPTERVVRRLAVRLGMSYAFFRSGENWPGAILTTLDILEHRNCPLVKGRRPKTLFTRHWGRATLRTQGPFGDLIVHSAHLHPSRSDIRKPESLEIIKAIAPDIQAGRSVILQGDLNHSVRMSSYKRWVDAGLIDTQAAAGNAEQPTIKADKPRTRIDYIFAAGPIATHLKDARPLFEGAFRTNPDDPGSFALSDHLPVMARFDR